MRKITPHKDRPMKHIFIRVPEDVLEDLKRIAPLKGMGGYQALIKFYISQGLRKDLRELWEAEHGRVETVLTECGIDPDQRQEILNRLKEDPSSGVDVPV
ncbi:MAG: hypothetical protein HY914_08805 [Desulfomonile tiedjei]|nr:hypothetical protein [Desulfomonile tiedjei]